MHKFGLALLTVTLIAGTAMAGGGIFGHKHKTVNTNGVHSIGVHICGSLECPPVRIFEGKCDKKHMSMHWGVCVCDKGYVPKDGKCDACPEGQYSDGIHGCKGCPEGKYMVHEGDTECTPCPDGYYCVGGKKYECPEHATCDGNTFTCKDGYHKDGAICKECSTYADCTADECCTLTGPADVCGHPTPQFWGFKDSGGTCRDCSYTYGASSNADECSKCDKTATPRLIFNNLCYPKKECPAGQFQAANMCLDCSGTDVYYFNANECAKCDKTPTPREMFTNMIGISYCALPCPDGQLHDYYGTCVDCSKTNPLEYVPADECAKCDKTTNPRVMFGYTCYPKLECPDGQFQGSNSCRDCSYTNGTKSNADECAKCDKTLYPRQMDGDMCVLKYTH